MTVSISHATVTPWWKQRWPWLLMAGPAIVIVAGVYTGYLAFTRQDALVVGDYYKRGKAINQDLRRDRVASTLGLSMSIGYDATQGMLAGQLRRNSDDHAKTEQLFLRLSHATCRPRTSSWWCNRTNSAASRSICRCSSAAAGWCWWKAKIATGAWPAPGAGQPSAA